MLRRSPGARACVALTGITLLLGGCADASGENQPVGQTGAATSAPAAPSSPSAPSAPSSMVREIVVDVADGVITPAPAGVEVSVGERLRLVVTSDAPDEVHVHGADVAGPVGPGTPFQAEVVLAQSGVFEVELHQSGALLFQLLVR